MPSKRRLTPPPEPVHPNALLRPEGERPCPICGSVMSQERERGVVADVCEAHGVWLDGDELRRLFESKMRTERNARKRAVTKAYENGRLVGVLYGAIVG